MWTPDYFVRFADLPASVEGVTIPNDDGTFDIYINSSLSEDRQQEKLRHELEHIQKDHFYRPLEITNIEREANGMPAKVCATVHEKSTENKKIPRNKRRQKKQTPEQDTPIVYIREYKSLEAMVHYLKSGGHI